MGLINHPDTRSAVEYTGQLWDGSLHVVAAGIAPDGQPVVGIDGTSRPDIGELLSRWYAASQLVQAITTLAGQVTPRGMLLVVFADIKAEGVACNFRMAFWPAEASRKVLEAVIRTKELAVRFHWQDDEQGDRTQFRLPIDGDYLRQMMAMTGPNVWAREARN